jgi:hypothetical protein
MWALAAGVGLVLTEGLWSDGNPSILVLDLIPDTPAYNSIEVTRSLDAFAQTG